MYIIFLNYVYEARFSSYRELLERYTSLCGWAEALVSTGAQVLVLQRFAHNAKLTQHGVRYKFVKDCWGPWLRGWQIPFRLHRLAGERASQGVERAEVVVVHVNSLRYPLQTLHLRTVLPSRCAVAVQHHAEKPWSGWRKWVQRQGLAAADGFLFAALELAQTWQESGIIRTNKIIHQVMEGSAMFNVEDRYTARQRTGLSGEPIFLWVGRLNANKDPLVVLSGFERALPDLPKAQLYMIYNAGNLLPIIQARIAQSPLLKDAVHLLGTIPHADIENYYNSADYFILGSHYEGSGYALIEAMACGVIPVVTDIPTFRIITDGGRIGALWLVGSAVALADALREIVSHPIAPRSQAVRQFFEHDLSYTAIATKAMKAYHTIWSRRI